MQTDEEKPSSPPQKVQARALSRSSILVRWEPPKKPNGRITVEITVKFCNRFFFEVNIIYLKSKFFYSFFTL